VSVFFCGSNLATVPVSRTEDVGSSVPRSKIRTQHAAYSRVDEFRLTLSCVVSARFIGDYGERRNKAESTFRLLHGNMYIYDKLQIFILHDSRSLAFLIRYKFF
jgi:hypothetical protein